MIADALLDEAGEHLFEIGKLIAEKIPRQRAGDGIHLVKVHVFPHHQKIRPHHAAQAEAAVQHPRDALHRFRRDAGKIGGKLGSVFLSPAQVLVAEREKFVLRFRFLAGGNDVLIPALVAGAVDLATALEIFFGDEKIVVGKARLNGGNQPRAVLGDRDADARTLPRGLDDDGIAQPLLDDAQGKRAALAVLLLPDAEIGRRLYPQRLGDELGERLIHEQRGGRGVRRGVGNAVEIEQRGERAVLPAHAVAAVEHAVDLRHRFDLIFMYRTQVLPAKERLFPLLQIPFPTKGRGVGQRRARVKIPRLREVNGKGGVPLGIEQIDRHHARDDGNFVFAGLAAKDDRDVFAHKKTPPPENFSALVFLMRSLFSTRRAGR